MVASPFLPKIECGGCVGSPVCKPDADLSNQREIEAPAELAVH